jgi:NAD(P)-dependent dehydrogenase (short-subunit alcohol dehydrogenase family)
VAKVLAERGATVVVASRDKSKVAAAVREIGPNARGELVDLSSFASIDSFVARARAAYPRVDVLINNAAVFMPPHAKTTEGFEITLGVNAVGTAHLTNGLLPLVAASPIGRIVNLSSSSG